MCFYIFQNKILLPRILIAIQSRTKLVPFWNLLPRVRVTPCFIVKGHPLLSHGIPVTTKIVFSAKAAVEVCLQTAAFNQKPYNMFSFNMMNYKPFVTR